MPETSFTQIIAQDSILSIAPPSQEHVARIEFIARALAYGCIMNYWSPQISVSRANQKVELEDGQHTYYHVGEHWRDETLPKYTENLKIYLETYWKMEKPQSSFLLAFEYLQHAETFEGGMFATRVDRYILTPKAFALLETPIHSKVFISYRRAESSAFALLLHDRLRIQGFKAFIDKQINPGEEWEKAIHNKLIDCDAFLVLMSPYTLTSEWVQKEIKWAIEADKPRIPIWHNGYEYKSGTITDPIIDKFLATRQGHPVKSEDILGYENTITSLLQFLEHPQ